MNEHTSPPGGRAATSPGPTSPGPTRPADSSAGPGAEPPREAIVAALVEMTHAQGEDVTPQDDPGGVTLVRRTPFLRVAPSADGGAELFFFYPRTCPDDARLTSLPGEPGRGATHRLLLDSGAMDADLIALEPLIEAAYAQNG